MDVLLTIGLVIGALILASRRAGLSRPAALLREALAARLATVAPAVRADRVPPVAVSSAVLPATIPRPAPKPAAPPRTAPPVGEAGLVTGLFANSSALAAAVIAAEILAPPVSLRER